MDALPSRFTLRSLRGRSPRGLRSGMALVAAAGLALAVSGCGDPAQASVGVKSAASYSAFVPSLPVSHPPFEEFHAGWMQRLDQPYVFVDHYGSYTQTGAHLPALLREMKVQGIEPDGPPFCLFYDDPASVSVDQLRSRACVPISAPRSPKTPLQYDVLPSRTIAYVFVTGPYPDAPRAYPKLLEYMSTMNWDVAGPVRETYYVPPSVARSPRDYLCEIQIPVQTKG